MVVVREKWSTQAAEILQKYLEVIGAVKAGTFCVDCETYYAAPHVECTPYVIPSSCWDLMCELLQGFMGNCVQSPSQYLQGKMNEIYSPVDTVQQYLKHFNSFHCTPRGVR